MAGKKATATPKRASKTDEKEGTSQHFITLPLSASARLMQAVNAEKLRRHVAGMKGRVTDSTIVAALIMEHLPPVKS